MSDFFKCFRLNVIHRYLLGYCIGGAYMYLEINGYTLERIVWFSIIVLFALLDLATYFFKTRNDSYSDYVEKCKIIEEKREQMKREAEYE